MRSRIFIKLLLTLLLSLSGIVLAMYLVVNSSFKHGFTEYLIQKEIKQTQGMSDFLITHYREHKNWDRLRHNEPLWIEALSSAKIPFPLKRRGPPRKKTESPHNQMGPPHRPPPHQMPPPRRPPGGATEPLAIRISLYDADKALVFGRRQLTDTGSWIALTDAGSVIGWLYFIPANIKSDELAQSFIEQQQQNLIFIALIVFIVSTLIASVWASLVLRPINRVIKASELISSGQYNVRVPIKGNDELTNLSLHFNNMAEGLKNNEAIRRQWQTDISHELRTPIAIIRGEVEALQDGIRKPTPENLSSIFEEVESLSLLVNDLHQLSLADNDALHMQFTQSDLLPVIKQQLKLFEPRMAEKDINLRLSPPQETNYWVYADAHRITQVLSNVLENSLRYTDTHGEVEISLLSSGDLVSITISDSAPSVDSEELERIFERLYCVDKSRSRSMSGSGLGLSICRNIVNAHNGNIYAKKSQKGGLSLIIELPLFFLSGKSDLK